MVTMAVTVIVFLPGPLSTLSLEQFSPRLSHCQPNHSSRVLDSRYYTHIVFNLCSPSVDSNGMPFILLIQDVSTICHHTYNLLAFCSLIYLHFSSQMEVCIIVASNLIYDVNSNLTITFYSQILSAKSRCVLDSVVH